MKLIFCIFFICSIPVFSFAKTCVKYDNNGNKIYYRCNEAPKSIDFTYDITTHRKSGKITKKVIVRESVCQEYGAGTILRRNCLSFARTTFKNKCRSFTKKYKKSSYFKKKSELNIEKEMFCRAENAIKFLR